MTDSLRRLTDKGLSVFRDFLSDLRRNSSLPVPQEFITSDELSLPAEGSIRVSRRGFTTKREAAEYLVSTLGAIDNPALMRDDGLWTWLAWYYFDDICPEGASGGRKVNADAHYVFDAVNSQRRYRHLLATPYLLLKSLPDHNRLFLDAPLHVHSDLLEQTLGRLYLIRKPCVRQLIDRLYFDEKTGRAKKGLVNQKKNARAGDLRNRLTVRVMQLQKTYDVDFLNGDQLLGLLGDEFRGWSAK